MDLITQGLLGATMAQSGAKQQETRMATGIGFLAGIAADADILIQSENDPLLNIEFHRHFTHSLFFVPLGALIVALLLWPFLRQRLAFARLYLFTFLGYCLSGVLDAFTSYGTHLLWPLSDERMALSIISVVDPAFTLILLIAGVMAYRKYSHTAARIGLLLAAVYLSFGWMQLQRAETVAESLIAARGQQAEQLLVKPTLANLLLWRSIYEFEGKLYVDAIRVGLFSKPRIYPGESIEKFVLERDLSTLPPASVLAQDVARFSHFSAGLLAIRPEQPNVLVDVRYSNLPMTLAPLWGIEINPEQPDQHAKYMLYRDSSRATREKFITLLRGGHLLD
ncbi:metal-dependent hydrolase [Nitrosomonas ureae]|uniref:Inner membrane protein n=1 Tax=Nitrosomonas ureae TaxID=44577 RepID=A0A0S3AI22_9PROT|nr:metal-dependent hydrolase [Nitrosomonas ureae]ALQ50837.1 hydrolase [Nitrosomonas ureae]PXX16564.1 inner membrane protein [Nitrosomonas ureae]SDT85727.1 inner membrane protein [Nitrosomonas ureae]